MQWLRVVSAVGSAVCGVELGVGMDSVGGDGGGDRHVVAVAVAAEGEVDCCFFCCLVGEHDEYATPCDRRASR